MICPLTTTSALPSLSEMCPWTTVKKFVMTNGGNYANMSTNCKKMKWQSVSNPINIVKSSFQFVPVSSNACLMKYSNTTCKLSES